jgi:hypothetical protein
MLNWENTLCCLKEMYLQYKVESKRTNIYEVIDSSNWSKDSMTLQLKSQQVLVEIDQLSNLYGSAKSQDWPEKF